MGQDRVQIAGSALAGTGSALDRAQQPDQGVEDVGHLPGDARTVALGQRRSIAMSVPSGTEGGRGFTQRGNRGGLRIGHTAAVC